MRALARHIVMCLVCTNVQGHATRCMQTNGEMDDVWCTSVRRFGETGETAAHGVAERRERCSPHSLSARHGCGATRDGGSDSDLGIRPPDPAQFEERGRGNHGEAASRLVFGSFSGSLDVLGFPHSVRQGPS